MADPRFSNIEFKVGIFVLASIAVIAVAIIFVGINKKVFVQKINIYIKSPSGEGIKKGMPVIFSGFQISRVDSIMLKDTGEVVIKVKIPNDYVKWIKEDSKVKLVSQNFIGSSSLVFEGGKGEVVKDGAEFILLKDKGLDEIIQKAKPVMDDLKIIVANIREITDKFSDDNGSFNIFMRGLASLGSDLEHKEGSMGYLLRSDYLKSETKKILDSLIALQDKIDKIAENSILTTNTLNKKVEQIDINKINSLIGISEKLIYDINTKVSKIDPILSNTEKISENIKLATDNLSKMRSDAEYILTNTNGLILNLSEKWPFKATKDEKIRKLKIP